MDGIGIDITDIIGMALPRMSEDKHSILCKAEAVAIMLEDWAADVRKCANVSNDDITFHVVLEDVGKGRALTVTHFHEIYDGPRMSKVFSEVHDKSGR